MSDALKKMYDEILKITGLNRWGDGSYEVKDMALESATNTLHNLWVDISAELATAQAENKRLKEKHGICEWTYDDSDDDFWDTTCGETYCFMEGGIKDNRVVFCHHCGRLVKEIIKGE